MQLRNKVIVITGASSGIGKELALQLGRRGNQLVLGARRLDLLKEIAQQIVKTGGEAVAVESDVSRRADVDALIEIAVKRFGRLDVVFSNAGISHPSGTIMDLSEAEIRKVMETNFMAAVYILWASVPVMQKTGGGLLAFVSSVVGKRGIARNAAYCSSKFALQGLTESIRPELRPKNIRVVTICPPGVNTPFFEVNGRGDRRKFRLHPVEKIVRMTIAACEREKREALLTIDSKLLHYSNVFFPRLLDWGIMKAKGVHR